MCIGAVLLPPFLLGGEIMNSEEQRIRRKVKLKEIGSLVKEARQQDNIEVRELSSKTGYTTQLIYAFENGHSSNMVILFDCYFCILTEETQKKLYQKIRSVCGE